MSTTPTPTPSTDFRPTTEQFTTRKAPQTFDPFNTRTCPELFDGKWQDNGDGPTIER